MVQENKTKFIKIRVTEEESKEISKRAQAYGFSVSDYVRRSALSDNILNPLYSKPVNEFLDISMRMYKITARCPDLSKVKPDKWMELCKEYNKEVENVWHFLR